MAFTWTSALETGHTLIDSQHKELIDVINKLLTACQQGQGADQVGQTVDFLVSYTKKHFSEEEALQQKSNYPDYANHRTYHATFVQTITDLSTELKQSGATPMLINKIVRNVGEWLINHIQQQDTKVAAHLKSAGGYTLPV
jgi:hemerythrin